MMTCTECILVSVDYLNRTGITWGALIGALFLFKIKSYFSTAPVFDYKSSNSSTWSVVF